MTREVGLIGHMAMQRGLITRDQLRTATREQTRQPERKLGELLVELGFIDEPQLEALLAAQTHVEGRGERVSAPAPEVKAVPKEVALGAIALKRMVAPRQPRGDGRRGAEGPRQEVGRQEVRPEAGRQEAGRQEAGRQEAGRQEAGRQEVGRQETERQDAEARRQEDAARNAAAEARAWLNGLLSDAVSSGASDVVLLPDQPVRLRRFGRWHDFTTGPVNAAGTERLLTEALPADARALLLDTGEATASHDVPGVGRFRLSVHREARGVGGSFHHAGLDEGTSAPGFALPSAIAGLTNFVNGLLIVAGPLGSGRTATLAGIVRLMTEDRSDHILLIESPAEQAPVAGDALVTQLEVGRHSPSFAAALAEAARLDVDVICVDELPNDAVDAALRAAHGEQFVVATVRSLSAVRAVEALVDAYPENERAAACQRVADALVAVVAQRLVLARDDAGLVLALEVLHIDEAARELIRTDQIVHLHAAMESGRERGNCALDEALGMLVKTGRITLETARAHARHPANFPGSTGAA